MPMLGISDRYGREGSPRIVPARRRSSPEWSIEVAPARSDHTVGSRRSPCSSVIRAEAMPASRSISTSVRVGPREVPRRTPEPELTVLTERAAVTPSTSSSASAAAPREARCRTRMSRAPPRTRHQARASATAAGRSAAVAVTSRLTAEGRGRDSAATWPKSALGKRRRPEESGVGTSGAPVVLTRRARSPPPRHPPVRCRSARRRGSRRTRRRRHRRRGLRAHATRPRTRLREAGGRRYGCRRRCGH